MIAGSKTQGYESTPIEPLSIPVRSEDSCVRAAEQHAGEHRHARPSTFAWSSTPYPFDAPCYGRRYGHQLSTGSVRREENALAINAFDLDGAVRQISGNLQLPNAEQTISLEKETQSLVVAARQSIGLLRSVRPLSLPMKRAVDRTTAYLATAEVDVESPYF